MMGYTRVLMLLGAVLLSGCAASTFTTTWKTPEATPLGFRGQKVVAAVLLQDEAARRLAEDRLAYEISARGAEGRTLYSLVPGAAVGNEQEARAALEAADVKGVIVMRPIHVDKNVRVTQPYQEQSYASFWGGYYGSGVALSYSSPRESTVSETTVVYVETLVYSLEQNKLVWGGLSKSTNPETLAELIAELSKAATSELEKAGLISKP
ncbi:hypothetical protein [Povalibacter sp.]|uniref:hypothetical protein n=1 Tax=Povalibacter sp. TaxID=1962978 RepID=UPI002F3F3249